MVSRSVIDDEGRLYPEVVVGAVLAFQDTGGVYLPTKQGHRRENVGDLIEMREAAEAYNSAYREAKRQVPALGIEERVRVAHDIETILHNMGLHAMWFCPVTGTPAQK